MNDPSPTDIEKARNDADDITLCDNVIQTTTHGATVEKEPLSRSSSSRDGGFASLSKTRKSFILATLSLAQFMDIFNACSVIAALPTVGEDLKFKDGTLQWMISAYALTFAAFMLISGRLGDIFHPKPIFVAGFAAIGLLSIPIGASVNPVMAIVFRALQGIGAAMNVPAALSLISIFFPDPKEQGVAYSIYGAAGAVGNVLGFILGGVLAAQVSWRWVFYLLALIVIPSSVASWFILPSHPISSDEQRRSVDWAGVSLLTTGLILFVFGISDPSTPEGWHKPRVILTLVLSVVLITCFFVLEASVKDPALPPKTWSNKNFLPLFFYGCSLYWFLFGCELQLIQIFTELWNISTLAAAIRCIPLGVAGGTAALLTPYIAQKVSAQILLCSGQLMMAVAAILFAFADSVSKYWSHTFVGMVVGMVGLGIAYIGCLNMVMSGVRQGEEGVVSATMFTSYQLGSTIGVAVMSSITSGVNANMVSENSSQFAGYAASFWSLLGMHGLMILITLVFVRN